MVDLSVTEERREESRNQSAGSGWARTGSEAGVKGKSRRQAGNKIQNRAG